MVGRSLEKNQAPATYVPWVMLGKQVNLANSADPAMANSAPSHGWVVWGGQTPLDALSFFGHIYSWRLIWSSLRD